MAVKLKNKTNKRGKFLCIRCDGEAGVGIIINGYVYCSKHGQKIKGERKDNGLPLRVSEKELLQPEVEKPTCELAPGRAEASPVVQQAVTKTPDHTRRPSGIMLQGRGRPRKDGEVTRMTKWRRKKEKQGKLI